MKYAYEKLILYIKSRFLSTFWWFCLFIYKDLGAMGLSDFERQRQANIERNKRLLDSLNLNTLSNEISEDIKKEESSRKKIKSAAPRSRKPTKPKEPVLPTRRSRRLAGVVLDGSEGDKLRELELAEDKIKREREELERLKHIRINGELSLLDLIKDEIESSDDDDHEEGDVKSEGDDEKNSKTLLKFQKFLNTSKNFSIGDYYETISKKDNSSDDIIELRDEFSLKKLYQPHEPNEIKLTKERMTYIAFHPSKDHKLILGGDRNGNCGIFNPQSTDKVDITSFKLHGKSICKFEFNMNDLNKVYTGSYDGSIRSIDLKKMKSSQFFTTQDDAGISDINYNNSNEIYYTTLDGEFGHLDIRTNGHHNNSSILRLSTKKIGGFAINPLNPYQIATASLDKSLKIWDIRSLSRATWNDIDDLPSGHLYGTYDSRLSVSIVDWNHSNDLVCNGYDDTINIFNLDSDSSNWDHKTFELDTPLKPDHKIKHNCQTGRWVSILKARWQKFPIDSTEKFVIGNMNKYFDIYDRNGNQLGHITDPLMTNVPAVCNFHPTENWLVGGGASGKVYLFC